MRVTLSGSAAFLLLLVAGCAGSAGDPVAAVGERDDALAAASVFSWDGGQQTPATLSYVPDANYDANYCELWVNGFGKGNFSNGGFTEDWLEAYVSVPAQYGTLVNVAMYVRSLRSDGSVEQDIVLGNAIAANYYSTGFYNLYSSRNVALTVDAFAFFVDVRRPDGKIVRLWQSAGGRNYGVAETFSRPPSGVKSLGGGEVVYANDAAAVFDLKHACD